MNENDHEYYAKKSIGYLVNRVINFRGGDKFITYGELAKAINYPELHTGSGFGSRIGITLGKMGHVVDDVTIDNWIGRIPFLQALVVLKNTKLPSSGLKEFYADYPKLNKEKQRDFIKHEYKRIFQFGERWIYVLNALGIENEKYKNKTFKKYNPFGSEGSPEHRNLRDHISKNPSYIGLDFNRGTIEYPLRSGDSVDVLFESESKMLGIEVKSIRSGNDDLERGIFQCVKYREVLKAEDIVFNKERLIDCFLVYEGEMDKKNIRCAKKLDVRLIRVEYNK